MKKTILLLMGASGCGKSTLEKQLLNRPDVYRVVSTTTRPMRDGEIQDVSYHFISKEEFNQKIDNNEFIQLTNFADNHYGTTKSEYTTDHNIAVLSIVPSSAVTFIPLIQNEFPNYDIRIVYFDISNERLKANMLARGDSEEDINIRLAKDDLVTQYKESGLVADILVEDAGLSDDIGLNIRMALDI